MTAPLQAAGIPFVWDPYPPEEMPSYRYGYGAVDRPFDLLVPANRLDEARALLGDGVGSASVIGLPAALPHGELADRRRRRGIWVFFIVFIGVDLCLVAVFWVLNLLGYLVAEVLEWSSLLTASIVTWSQDISNLGASHRRHRRLRRRPRRPPGATARRSR